MQAGTTDRQAIEGLFNDVGQLKREAAELRVQFEAQHCIVRAMRVILSALNPEFKRLSDDHIRGLRDHFLSLGLDENDPLVKVTIAEAERFLGGDKPSLRSTMRVIRGGCDQSCEEKR